jgi:hypothetical protein
VFGRSEQGVGSAGSGPADWGDRPRRGAAEESRSPPASCFAHVGDYSKPHSWKLPYLTADGAVDAERLPKAIQAILSNYRGEKVAGIPEEAIPAVLLKAGPPLRRHE